MRFTASTSALQEAIKTVLPAVGKKAHMPALAGILFSVSRPDEDGKTWLRLAATDLEFAISTHIEVRQGDYGAAVLQADMIRSIVAAATSQEITLEPDMAATRAAGSGQHFTMWCGRARYEIAGYAPASEFPTFEEKAPSIVVLVPARILATMIEHTTYAAAKNDNRRYLEGVNVEINSQGDLIRLTATNAYRLATVGLQPPKPATNEDGQEEAPLIQATGSGSQIVPAKALEALGRALKGVPADETVRLGIDPQWAVLAVGPDTYRARLIDGTYPDWRRIMPTTFEVTATGKLTDFVTAIRQTEVMADKQGSMGVGVRTAIDPDMNKMVFRGSTQGVGSAECELPATIEGKTLTISYRSEYLADILKHIPTTTDTDSITIQFAGKTRPIVLEYTDYACAQKTMATLCVKTMVMPFGTDV